MILILNDEMNNAMLEKLAAAYNELNEKQLPVLQLFLSSPGGETNIGAAMRELINRHSERTIVTAYSYIESAAFDLFFKVGCARVILPTTIGTAHISRWCVIKGEGGIDLDRREAFKTSHLRSTINERVEFFKALGMTDNEISLMKRGEDIYLDSKRLQKMLQKSIKNEVHRKFA